MRFRALLAVFIFFIAANVPLWLAGRSFGLMFNGLFGIEFLIIGVISVFVRPVLTAGLLFGAILLDLLGSIGKTYFFDLSELIQSAPSMSSFAPSHLANLAIVIAAAAAACVCAYFAVGDFDKSEQRWLSSCFVAMIMCGLIVDYSHGQIPLSHSDSKAGTVRLLRASAAPLLLIERQQWVGRQLAKVSSASATASASSALPLLHVSSVEENAAKPDIVFVLVESWGLPFSKAVHDALMLPYQDSNLLTKYQIGEGHTPFRGATLAGETRELCNTTLGFGVMNASEVSLKDCLPARLESMGYHTTAVHGFSGRMFERAEWYRRAKFEETWFREQLQPQGLPLCPGPFPGICDAAVADWIGTRLQEEESPAPQLVYWVTLNSHLPVPIPNSVQEAPACSSLKETMDLAMCSWFQLIYNVHRSVARLAMRVQSRPTMFVIVGDHAPPFSNPELRGQFSSEVVPYIVLQPKQPVTTPMERRLPIMMATHRSGNHRRHVISKRSPESERPSESPTGSALEQSEMVPAGGER